MRSEATYLIYKRAEHLPDGIGNVGLDETFVRIGIGTPPMMQHFRKALSSLTS